MVDTRDLKSLGQKCPCGFDSRLRHKRTALAVLLCLLFTPSPCGTAPVGHWGAFYVIEVETKSGNIEKEAELYYSAEGVLIKATSGYDSDYDYEDYLPSDIQSALESFINDRYPGAVIVDSEYDDGEIEVEIIHDGRGKDVYFNKINEWLRTEWDVRKSELPAAVLTQVNAAYPSWKIDDAEFMETPSGNWFVIELEKGESEVKIRITANGVIL